MNTQKVGVDWYHTSYLLEKATHVAQRINPEHPNVVVNSYYFFILALTAGFSLSCILGRVPEHDGFVVTGRQYFKTILCDQNRVFKLCAALAVRRDRRPIVIPRDILLCTQVYHGLNGKHVTDLHGALRFILGVVRDIGNGVKEGANAVTAVGAIHAAFRLFSTAFNGTAQITVQRPWFYHTHGLFQAIKCSFHEALTVFIHISNHIGFVQIGVITTLVINRNIQIDDVYLSRTRIALAHTIPARGDPMR